MLVPRAWLSMVDAGASLTSSRAGFGAGSGLEGSGKTGAEGEREGERERFVIFKDIFRRCAGGGTHVCPSVSQI